mmetsp:Transcript_18465/g.20311  ORF Transcript_18465/g.20311 Transcript_18465/m.20311 type:complete len:129 (+) Transcript_18465:339-725(+)
MYRLMVRIRHTKNHDEDSGNDNEDDNDNSCYALSKVLGVTMTVKAMVMGNGDKDQQQQQLPPPSQKHLTLLDIRSNCSGHYECGDGSRTGWLSVAWLISCPRILSGLVLEASRGDRPTHTLRSRTGGW